MSAPLPTTTPAATTPATRADPATGMTRGQARTVEGLIIGLCVTALVFIFQPFSLRLFSIGCVLVIIGGLAFNLVPFCKPGVTFRTLGRVALVVLVCLVVVALLGMGSAELYVKYIEYNRAG